VKRETGCYNCGAIEDISPIYIIAIIESKTARWI